MPIYFKIFFVVRSSVRAHFFLGARTAFLGVRFVHLCHPNLLSPFPFIHSVLPTNHLFVHDQP